MSTALTPGQHALLDNALRLQRQRVEQALQAQLQGTDRITHAQQLLADDARELPAHEDEREVDQARGDQLLAELRALDDALQRLRTPGYGRCVDCGAVIPFDRLQLQPQALRCTDCQTAQEAAA
ncbi:MAG: molecular chaperone DnaK [Roseateles sp.]|nr:MAG: molecular chaperone DnaK [Roseateles sp.]